MSRALVAGLMSGTSLDGVDAVLLDPDARPRVLAHAHHVFDAALRAELLALNASGPDELARAARCANELARHYAKAVRAALAAASVGPADVRAIGCHGQTVRHRPETGYTVQIGNPALLAELTGIAVVADFRSRDVAAQGQGAPLAPAFHAAVFRHGAENRAVLNLGGMANLTWLPANGAVTGFDTGPGNCLLDLWAQRHLGKPMDEDGAWAAGAALDRGLLESLLVEPFFSLTPPKSTGRDTFNGEWLRARIPSTLDPQIAQSTLLELTVESVARALHQHCPGVQRLVACGGGVRNRRLMERLRTVLAPLPVDSSAEHGIEPGLVEAAAFAWLAHLRLEGKTGNLPTVTGAKGPRVLGAIYPG